MFETGCGVDDQDNVQNATTISQRMAATFRDKLPKGLCGTVKVDVTMKTGKKGVGSETKKCL